MTGTRAGQGPGLPPPVLAALAEIAPVRAVRPLVGGRGGRTFAVDHDRAMTVVHLRAGGAEVIEAEARATRRAHAVGVGPEVLAVLGDEGALVTRWVPGAVLSRADLRDEAVLMALAAAVRRLHDAPPDPAARVYDAPAARTRYLATARGRGLLDDPVLAGETARTDAIAQRLAAGAAGASATGVHADLVPSNLVLAEEGIVLLDHEYAGLADPALDLGSLAATGELGDEAIDVLVAAYLAAGPDAGSVTTGRVRDWRDLTRHAWFVWVALGDELGPERARWQAWAARVRARWAAGGA